MLNKQVGSFSGIIGALGIILCPFLSKNISKYQDIKDEFIYGMVSNSSTIGGYKIFPKGDVILDDGEFEVLLVKSPRNPGELNEMITSLLAQEMDPEYLFYFKASEIEFIAEEEVPWTLDGENGGAHKSIAVKNMKQAMKIYTGKKR